MKRIKKVVKGKGIRKSGYTVNGAVPGGKTFGEMFPIGTPERVLVESKIAKIGGQSFLEVCCAFEREMVATREAEAKAKAEKIASARKKVEPVVVQADAT